MVSRTVVGDVVAQPKLLLVDDEVKWAALFAATLAKTGLDIKTCNDGPTAIEALRNWPADVVLLDERMPGMSGHEVCRRLRAGGYSGAILIYSAYDTVPDLVLAHEAGADDHVSKAADLVVLQAKIRRAVERKRELLTSACHVPSAGASVTCGLLHDNNVANALPVDAITLTRLEERLLRALISVPGTVVSLESLLVAGWGRNRPGPALLYDVIANLRKKLESAGWRIVNVRARGYLVQRVELAPRSAS